MKLSAQFSFFNKVGFVDKLLITKHLGVMIKSGIPLSEAIETVRGQSTSPAVKKLLTGILEEVNNGQSLEKALSKYPDVFDPFYVNLVGIGEQSGNLEKNLLYLSEHLKKTYDFRKKVRGALMYPVLILIVTFVAGGAISFFVLPKLIELFSSLDVELPLSTKILLFVANMMRDFGIAIFVGFAVLGVILRSMLVFPKVKYQWDKLLLLLPGIGRFLQYVEISFMCRNIGIMLKSGLPINIALLSQYRATTNLVFKKYIKKIAEEIEKGQSISKKIDSGAFPFLPLLVGKMLGVGEKTGKLDESFTYLGDFFADEVDSYSKNFASLIEPAVLIVIGLIVAFTAMAIISPIYQLTSGVRR